MMLAADAVGFPLLPALVVVPLLTAAIIAVLPASRQDYTKLAALVGSTVAGMMSAYLLWNFDADEGGLQFVTRWDWVESLGLSWFFAVDGMTRTKAEDQIQTCAVWPPRMMKIAATSIRPICHRRYGLGNRADSLFSTDAHQTRTEISRIRQTLR